MEGYAQIIRLLGRLAMLGTVTLKSWFSDPGIILVLSGII